jgi:hypothetical protein
MRATRCLLLIALIILTSAFALPTSSDQRCFPETGFCIAGRFRQYWEQNGGLAVFGFPIGPQAPAVNREDGRTYQTQWFERARFEYHPENRPPYDVLLGRLGDDALLLQGRSWFAAPRDPGPFDDCLWFPQTGFNVCDVAPGLGFKSYWESHGLLDPALNSYGRSLALFGLPLSAPQLEVNPDDGRPYLTQWFERARFELHSENPAPYTVLLGLLGNELQGRTTPRYLWPNPIPPGRAVYPAWTRYDGGGFVLALARPGELPSISINGGPSFFSPPIRPGPGTPVVVRGIVGTAYNARTGTYLTWNEGGWPYVIHSDLTIDETVQLANSAELLPLVRWRERLP